MGASSQTHNSTAVVVPHTLSSSSYLLNAVRCVSTSDRTTPQSPGPVEKPVVAPSFWFKGYHMTSYGLLVLIPTGILLAPSSSYPVDMLLNVILPVHMALGLDMVLDDYVYGPTSRIVSKAALYVVAVLTAVGLFKINSKDVGISQSLKLLWKAPGAHPSS